jgi:hypothetical protein
MTVSGKTNLIFLIAILFLASCGNSDKNSDGKISSELVRNPVTASGENDKNKLPEIEFEEDFHDFGKIIQGEIVTYAFKFKNTGKSDLLISRVSTSCGCTASEYPREPIKPGEEGNIKITFNSRGRIGVQRKTATILSNAQPNRTTLTIKALIFVPEK